jgi:hypothetical protein
MTDALAALHLALALLGSNDPQLPLPQPFQGTWDLTPAACADPDGVTRLVIAGGKLQFYEMGGEVISAFPEGDGSVVVELDWWSVDDTDANDRPIIRRLPGRLTLSPDQSGLQVTVEGDATSYARCPAALR